MAQETAPIAAGERRGAVDEQRLFQNLEGARERMSVDFPVWRWR
jgi:hypothetical protein